MAKKQVSVRLVAENGRQVRAELEGIGNAGAASFKNMSREVDTAGIMLTRLAGIAAGALSIRQVVQYADTWTDLTSRVDLATGSQEKGAQVMERLADMARRTYSSLESTTESYLSNSTALRELGLSTAESLDFTEALNNAMVVSGAKAERAASVQNALAKAMALGKLSGDNLNTVIQSGGRVAELLAEELDTTVSGLRQMGTQGAITGDVIRTALVGNLELLRDEADSMPATIGDAFTLIGNAALQLVGDFDKLLGASSMVADALILVADNLDHIAVIAASFAAFMAGRYVVALAAARVATFSLATALVTLRAALIRTGIGALIVAAGELVYWLGRVVVASDGVGNAFRRMFNVGKETFLGVGRTAWGLMEILAGIASGITGSFVRAFAEIARAWDGLVNGMAAAWNAIAGTSLGETLGLTKMETSDVSGTLRGLADTLFEGGEASIRRGGQRIVDAGRSVAAAFAASVESGAEAGTDALDDAAASADRVADALDKTSGAAKRAGAAGKKAGAETKKGADEAKQGWDAVAASLVDYARDAMDWGKGLGSSLVGAFQSAENAFREFVKTGKLDFKDLISSMLADLATLSFRQNVLGPLAGAIGGMFGGGDALTRALRSAGAPVAAGVFHTGGLVGAGGASRQVPAFAFADAPRMHSGGWAGLRSDEVPAILQRGERVLSRREVAAGGGREGTRVRIELGDGLVGQILERAGSQSVEIVQGSLRDYDRLVAPRTLARVSQDPRRMG